MLGAQVRCTRRDTCSAAGGGGHLSCLEYAHVNGCPWDKDTCSAAGGGHLSCLEYAHSSDRTIKLLEAQEKDWDTREADVKAFINSCGKCQKTAKGRGTIEEAYRSTMTDLPFAKTAVDTGVIMETITLKPVTGAAINIKRWEKESGGMVMHVIL